MSLVVEILLITVSAVTFADVSSNDVRQKRGIVDLKVDKSVIEGAADQVGKICGALACPKGQRGLFHYECRNVAQPYCSLVLDSQLQMALTVGGIGLALAALSCCLCCCMCCRRKRQSPPVYILTGGGQQQQHPMGAMPANTAIENPLYNNQLLQDQ